MKQMDIKYKFKSLLVYSSDEWMANSTKRYRTVFDRNETTYMRVEFAFYNKLFDEEPWECKIELKAIKKDGETKKELCNLDSKMTISSDENVIYVRDGWGNQTFGTYWYEGEYLWEAYIDGVLVGSQTFFVNDVGLVTREKNPYFEVEHVKLYCGDVEGWKQEDRKYLTKINGKNTQYLWCEMKVKNLSAKAWNYELFFNYFDDAGQPKAQTSRANKIEADKLDWTYTFDVGWGNSTAGSWKDDKYTLEIVFMDTLAGAISFECGEEEIEGVPELITTHEKAIASGAGTKNVAAKVAEEKDEKTLEQLLEELDQLIGLDSVKKSIRENITYLNFAKIRKEKGFKDNSNISLHSIFTGNPGTGKTTIVKMLGKIYQKMGLLTKGHVVEADRATLVAEYIGQTAPKTKKAIDTARGGILFIDEAYALAREDDDKDFGKEVIEVLLKEMSDGKGDIAIIGAGYPKKMQTFLDSNPGLKSRFGHYFHFDDYLPEELYSIALYAAAQKEVVFTEDADRFLKEQLIESYRKRDESFGNARFVFGVIEEAKHNMGIRLMKSVPDMNELSKEQLQTIEYDDLKGIFTATQSKKLTLKVNDKHLNEALAELNELVGMQNIKDEVSELVKLIKYYNDIGKDVVNKFSLHSIFTGNPGTGKTTLARIIAKIYKSLGLLERGHVVEVDRAGLVGGYVGQTAQKAQGKIDEAMGGVLFIDEAYSLSEGGENDFGKEAIEIILKRMEDFRGKFGVIAAGYPDNMHKFVESNPGLKSRFDKTFQFNDYNPQEMLDIALMLLKKEQLKPTDPAKDHLKVYFEWMFGNRDKYFGNARSVRQVIGEAIRNQNLRMAEIPTAERKREHIETLTIEDVAEFKAEEKQSKGQSLGFRFGAK
ncbi:MAG: AAA family ATPase [Bacteroidia bacterium]|nr:AAA family ATPase [Bacteroidia bacterium]